MTFGSPLYFLLLIPVGVASWFIYRKRIRSGIAFPALTRIVAGNNTWRLYASHILPIFYLAGVILAVTAIARPRKVLSRMNRSTNAIAIEMVVDVSGSMEALDLSDIAGRKIINERTRLDAVKKTFARFVEIRSDDLIGLITFGGYATTRTPLTMDHSALLHVLKGVNIPKPSIGKDGNILDPDELNTAIGDGLATACARLESAETKSRIVVLLSDGVSNTGIIKPEQAAKAAKDLEIKVYTIGIGSTGSAPFKTRNVFNKEVIAYGNVELDEKLLKEIASTTGGQYFNVRNPKGLDSAIKDIDKLEKTEIERDVYYQYNELFPWFLGPGLCLILMAAALNLLIARRMV